MPEPAHNGTQPIERHLQVDFVVQEMAEPVTGFLVTPSPDRRRYDVAGNCPRCQGRTTTTWTVGTGNGYKGLFSARRATPEADDGLRSVFCDCGHSHANRPEDAVFRGCGAHWRVGLS